MTIDLSISEILSELKRLVEYAKSTLSMVEISSHLICIHEHIECIPFVGIKCVISTPKAVPTALEHSQPDAKTFVQLSC